MAFTSRKLQDALRVVHLWLGLAAGLFIVMMGLSGTVIIFRSQIEAFVTPRVSNSSPAKASLAAIARNLAALRPGARISRITFPETADSPLIVQADRKGEKRTLLFDPSSGQAMGEKPALAWLDWLVDLHQNLLSGKTGRAWTGAIGVVLLLLSASGLFSWLAGTRDWKRTLALPQTGPWRRMNFQTHKWAGLWTSVLLIVVSATGMVLALPDAFQQAIRMMIPEHTTVASAPAGKSRTGQSLLPLDEYMHGATTALPGGVVRELRLPARGGKAVTVTLWKPGDIRPKGGNVVLLDPASARVISVETASAAPLSVKFVDLANAIHKTELGGLPLKFAWSLLGLAPALLFISGLGIWWQRKQARGRSRIETRVEKPKVASMTAPLHQ